MIPIELPDILSLEIPNAARELYLELDTSSLILIGESIQRIQTVYGKIPATYGKGYSAKVQHFIGVFYLIHVKIDVARYFKEFRNRKQNKN